MTICLCNFNFSKYQGDPLRVVRHQPREDLQLCHQACSQVNFFFEQSLYPFAPRIRVLKPDPDLEKFENRIRIQRNLETGSFRIQIRNPGHYEVVTTLMAS